MDVRGRVKTEGFIKPLALRDGCKGGVKGLSSRAQGGSMGLALL